MRNVRAYLSKLHERILKMANDDKYTLRDVQLATSIQNSLLEAIEKDEKETLKALKGSVTERSVKGKLTKGCVIHNWGRYE